MAPRSLQRYGRSIVVGFVTLICIVVFNQFLLAQEPPATNNLYDGFPVTLGEQSLFRVREGIPGVMTAEERAEIISDRISIVAQDPQLEPSRIQAVTTGEMDVIKVDNTVLFTILESDSKAAEIGLSEGATKPNRTEIRNFFVNRIREAVQDYREERSLRSLIRGIILALASTLGTILLLRLLLFASGRAIDWIQNLGERQEPGSRRLYWQVFGPRLTNQLLIRLIRLTRLVLILGILYLYLPFFLSQFPITKPLGDSVLNDVVQRVGGFATSFANYLPNLITLGLLALFVYYLIGWVRQVVVELGQEDTYPWFYPEWIQPTIRLATFLLIAIACVIGSPYLPGFGSPAFQGVSLFLGALITLGSSSAVSNAVSGIILIYTRAFQLEDVIRIDDIFGRVDEKSLFVTRILTPKKEIVTVPNSTVLSSNVTNYSAIARQPNRHLLLHTTITLGYDVPWRKVHDVLVGAATATEQVVPEPSPFVLQTSLNDFNVSYELNVYTDSPESMAKIYSDLHQNIQDFCNQEAIEILSPTYSSLRDGNHSTIPENYLPEDYQPPGFRIGN